MNDQDDDFKETMEIALNEIKDLMLGLDQLILALGSADPRTNTADNVSLIYRRVHTIKSNLAFVPNSKFVGLLAENLENFLSHLRDKHQQVEQSCVDNLLFATDLCTKLLLKIENNQVATVEESRAVYDCTSKLRRLSLANTG